VALTPQPYLAPKLKKEQRYTSTPLWTSVAYSSVNFTVSFDHLTYSISFFYGMLYKGEEFEIYFAVCAAKILAKAAVKLVKM